MKIKIEKRAVKYLESLQPQQRRLILNGITGLTAQPPQGDIKPMKGYKDGRYRLRIGKYRIIYRYDSEDEAVILIIIDIGSRGDIYK